VQDYVNKMWQLWHRLYKLNSNKCIVTYVWYLVSPISPFSCIVDCYCCD